MEGFLALGFLIGMQHALEADHLAAIGAMATDGKSGRRGLVLRGAVWGLGHTTTLFAICAAAVLLGVALSPGLEAALEFCVGVMLVLLGVHVFVRMWRKKVHFHVHDHGEGAPHFHAHSHEGAKQSHDQDPHAHRHPVKFPLRALAIGLIHGAAGSAGLLALAVAATQDPLVALSYVAVFGFGSILGMAALSFVASLPLVAIEQKAKRLYQGLSVAAGTLAVVIGIDIMVETGSLAATVF